MSGASIALTARQNIDARTTATASAGGAATFDNLEVSHGPQSTLYGGEAVGGVVAIRGQRGAGHLSARLQEARWFIRNIQQRFETILRVAQAIVERQRRFFEHGDVAMRPMVLPLLSYRRWAWAQVKAN